MMVANGVLPPRNDDPLEDWVSEEASPAEVARRVEVLASRAERARLVAGSDAVLRMPEPPPEAVVIDGVLEYAGRSVVVSPVEESLLTALLVKPGSVVRRELLLAAGWPDESPDRNVMDVAMARLRRRVTKVGLTLSTVRGRGYRLAPAVSDS